LWWRKKGDGVLQSISFLFIDFPDDPGINPEIQIIKHIPQLKSPQNTVVFKQHETRHNLEGCEKEEKSVRIQFLVS
jgi:hypothetical protein